MNKIECFKIQLLQGEIGHPFTSLSEMSPIFQINCDKFCEAVRPKIIFADPFLFVKDDTLYLFYEMKKLYEDGVLVMQKTRDLKSWSRPETVLQESFHLSYPCVFDYEGQTFMIPETCAAHEIRLYKADDESLTHFSYYKTLLSRERTYDSIIDDYSDSSIFHDGNVFYLMTTVNYNGINHLELYISNYLDGPYRPHPNSPIVRSQKYGRNGGCLLHYGEKLYRVAQDCVEHYGDDINLFEVDIINAKEYQEHLVKESILRSISPFYSVGGHQINAVEFMGKMIVATDAKEYHLFVIPRLLKKMIF